MRPHAEIVFTVDGVRTSSDGEPSFAASVRSFASWASPDGTKIARIDLEDLVITDATGKQLLRMTLSDFERNLDPAKFARVHRSWIVNLDCVERVEPAGGGRMLLHMSTGHAVPASRTGARFLRNRVI